MNHYLVIFDRSKGTVLRHRRYRDRNEAIKARFDAERDHRGEPDIEVVVLGSRSWEALKRTHGRYFKSIGQLASSA